MAVLGAIGEIGAGALKQRLGMVAEVLEDGTAGRRLRAAKVATAVGAIGAATVARHNWGGGMISGVALLAGSALTRFGPFEAGVGSMRDPESTVEPEQARKSI